MSAARARVDVLVVGAGPAGLAAATAAAEAGAVTCVIDAAPRAGGQYWMQSSLPDAAAAPQARAGAAAIDAARAAGVTLHLGAEIWAVFPDRRVVATTAAGSLEIAGSALVVASGAHDRVPPFPGWTLPGVVTAGGAQRLAKLGGVAAGSRVVVAGSGPFLLVVAGALRRAGATLAGFVEAARPNPLLVATLARHPDRWAETARLLGTIAPRETRTRFGWIVTAAHGDRRVASVDIAPLGRDGVIERDRGETIDGIDALVTGWGFRPAIEVTSLLRCEHAFDDAAGGWFCVADAEAGRTSVPHVFAAGEVTGVAGALPARLSGRLAGIAAAADAGFPTRTPSADRARLSRDPRRARAFATAMNRAFAPPAAIDDLAAGDTIVCRCEEVTKDAVLDALRDGAHGTLGAKLWTRAGMGRCQGRMCGWAIARLASPGNPAAAGYNRPHIPLRPVALSIVNEALADS